MTCSHGGCLDADKFKTETLADILNSDDWNASINDPFFMEWFDARNPEKLLKKITPKSSLDEIFAVLDALAFSDSPLLHDDILDKLKEQSGKNKKPLEDEFKLKRNAVKAEQIEAQISYDTEDEEPDIEHSIYDDECKRKLEEYGKKFVQVTGWCCVSIKIKKNNPTEPFSSNLAPPHGGASLCVSE